MSASRIEELENHYKKLVILNRRYIILSLAAIKLANLGKSWLRSVPTYLLKYLSGPRRRISCRNSDGTGAVLPPVLPPSVFISTQFPLHSCGLHNGHLKSVGSFFLLLSHGKCSTGTAGSQLTMSAEALSVSSRARSCKNCATSKAKCYGFFESKCER